MRLRTITVGLGGALLAGSVIAAAELPAAGRGVRDLWIHPRGDQFDPKLHYKDAGGELYYHEENEIEGALADFEVEQERPLRISIGLGPQLFAKARASKGELRPVFLWDSNGDGQVDRSVAGRIDDDRAVFETDLLDVDPNTTRWQIGVRYGAGGEGEAGLNNRYLASMDSTELLARLPQRPPTADVAERRAPGLLIFKYNHAAGFFDFEAFLADPAAFEESFDALTKAADTDDWTVEEAQQGRLVTHFESEDLFIVRTTEGLALDVEWGDVPLQTYLSDRLHARADADGCLNSRDVALVSEDGSPAVVPQRILYCPGASFAFFEAPDGYEVGLSARNGSLYEHTEAGTSTLDNLRLYGKQVYPRSPSSRATGSVLGNIGASFAAAGQDLGDLGRHAVAGETRVDMHQGTRAYRVSPLSAVPFALFDLVRGKPLGAAGRIVTGVESGVQTAADVVSATNNAVVVPLVQLGVGATVSPASADGVGDTIGATTSAFAKNLPGSERSLDAWNPISVPRHDRAFNPSAYTRTDTQLNIDRLLTVIDAVGLGAILSHNHDNTGGGPRSGDGGGAPPGGGGGGGGGAGGGGGVTPPPPPPGCRY